VYPPKEESSMIEDVLKPIGVTPARIEEVQLTEAMIELVKAGLGVAALARWAVQPMIDAKTLVARPLTARGLHREWRAVTPKDLARADFVVEFIDLLSTHAPTSRRGRPDRHLLEGPRLRRASP
jgi:LysR family transcriptional regulator for metE and metH